MKKIFEWVGGFALIAFSFYFTDQVSLLVANKSELMEEIKVVSKNYNVDPINAVINTNDNTIIPGKFGKKVNSQESYLNMHDFGSFNENYLVFDYLKPETSLKDNKDKYILSGNEKNRQVSIILEKNDDIAKYLTNENIKYDLIVSSEEEIGENNAELINGSSVETEFKKLNSKISNNKHICVMNYSHEKSCIKNNYYLIKPELYLQNSNPAEIKNQIKSGSIILISANTKLENIKLILNEIAYKDLKIVYISELIDEKGTV